MERVKPRLLFYDDPYMRETVASVVDIEDNIIWLDRTIFFAESGGQESDRGYVGGIRLVDVRPDDFGHILERKPGFNIGDTVQLMLDWERRYRIMRLHSAAHIVYFAVREVLGDIEVIGSHVSYEKARLDYNYPGRISDYFPQIMDIVNRILSKPAEIVIYRKPERPEIRIWKLGGWEIPCGGLHVRNVSEIGVIRLKRRNLGRGKERIEVFVD